MATVFSTATLGLNVDARQFNKELRGSEKITTKALQEMQSQADAFDRRWTEMTRGIKDTRRIISGILISQGFYALMNAFTAGAAAALEFSSAMESASVSLEYFVDAAAGTQEAAREVSAYLREVNEFAARTPFNTSEVLSLSKYMQSVGVAMSQTQSVLTVLTDAAAATGATSENLQRITFALGQIMTKGRLANEEIRQLANANIPIYEILQEELGLTGAQISNIGKYWVDAGDSVVAILRGLEKRYNGAADRIADTFVGMADTIVDDAKIIADEAFGGLYDDILTKVANIRDTLDDWREVVNEFGSVGLARHISLEIDPTGQLTIEILNIVGHLRQLKDNIVDLYHTAQPLLRALAGGSSQYAQIVIGGLTAMVRVTNEVITILNKLGITSGDVANIIARFIVAYQAAKYMSLLGQAASSVAITSMQAAQSIASLLPACISANTGVVGLTASVFGLVAALSAAFALMSGLSNSFSGLQVDSAGFEQQYAEYAEQMQAYNQAIEDYRQKYRDSYESMSSGSDVKLNKDDTDSKKSGGGSGGDTTKEWVAAFDEVYDVPDEDEISGGSSIGDVVEQLGDIFGLLKGFKFPNWTSLFAEKPTFGDVFGDSLLSGDVITRDWLKTFLPPALLGAAAVLGRHFKTEADSIKGIIAGKQNADLEALDASNGRKIMQAADVSVDKLTQELEQFFNKQFTTARAELQSLSGNERTVQQLELLNAQFEKELTKLEKQIELRNTGAAIAQLPQSDVAQLEFWRKALRESKIEAVQRRLELLLSRKLSEDKFVSEAATIGEQVKQLRKDLDKLTSGFGDTYTETIGDFKDSVVAKITQLGEYVRDTDFSRKRFDNAGVSAYATDEIEGYKRLFLETQQAVAKLDEIGVELPENARIIYNTLKTVGPTLKELNSVVPELRRVNDTLLFLKATATGLNAADSVRLPSNIEDIYNKLEKKLTTLTTRLDGQSVLTLKSIAEQREQARLARKELEKARKEQAAAEAQRAAREARQAAQQQQIQHSIADMRVRTSQMFHDFEDLRSAALRGEVDWDKTAQWLGNVDPQDLMRAVSDLPVIKQGLADEQKLLQLIETELGTLSKQIPDYADLNKLMTQRRLIGGQIGNLVNAKQAVDRLLDGLEASLSTDEIVQAITGAATALNDYAISINKVAGILSEDARKQLTMVYGDVEPTGTHMLELRDAIEDIQAELIKRHKLLLEATRDTDANVLSRIETLQGLAEQQRAAVASAAEQLDELTSLNKAFFRDASFKQLLDATSVQSGVALSDEITRASAAFQAALKHALPSFTPILAANPDRMAAYLRSIPDITKATLASMQLASDGLLLTGTTAMYAAQGMDSYGSTLSNYIAKLFANAGSYAESAALPVSEAVQLKADLGTVFEPVIRQAAASFMAQLGVTTYAPGRAMHEAMPVIVQYDSALSGLIKSLDTAYDAAFMDIKLFGDDITKSILAAAERTEKGIYRLNGTMLLSLGREKNAYQMLYQAWVAGSRNSSKELVNYMGLMSRDTDFVPLLGENGADFKRVFDRLLQSGGHGVISEAELAAIGGRIFSTDAFNAFNKAAGGTATAADYSAAVVDQLLTDISSKLTFEELSKGLRVLEIYFPRDFEKALDLPRITRATHDLAETFALIANAKDAGKYLVDFAHIVDDTNKTLSAIRLPPAIQRYAAVSRGPNQWAQSILGTSGPDLRISTRSPLAKYIDNAVTQYRLAVATGQDLLEAATTFRDALVPVYNAVEVLKSGGAVTEEVGSLLGNFANAALNEFDYFNKALGKLIEQPAVLDRVTTLTGAVSGQLARLSQTIIRKGEVATWSVNGLINNYTELMDLMQLTNDKAMLELGDTLQEIQRLAAAGKIIDTDVISKLRLPIEVAGAADSMPYVARTISDAIANGALQISDAAATRLEELFSNYTLPVGTIDTIQQRAIRLLSNEQLGSTVLGLDIETTGRPSASRMPDVTQVAVGDMNSDRLLSSFINAGSSLRNRENIIAMMNLADDAGNITDVAQAWKTWVDSIGGLDEAVKVFDKAPTLAEFWQQVRDTFGAGNIVTGYNAVGASGFDFNILRSIGQLPDDLFVLGTDLMGTATRQITEVLGASPRVKLSDLYSMLTGAETSGLAHMADYDVGVELRTLYRALNDGSFMQLLQYVKNNSPQLFTTTTDFMPSIPNLTAGVKTALLELAPAWRAASYANPALAGAATTTNFVLGESIPSFMNYDQFLLGMRRQPLALPPYKLDEILEDALGASEPSFAAAFNHAATNFADSLDDAIETAASVRTPGQAFKDFFARIRQGASGARDAAGSFGERVARGWNNFRNWATDVNPFNSMPSARASLGADFSSVYAEFAKSQAAVNELYKKAAEAYQTGGEAAARAVLDDSEALLDAYNQSANNIYHNLVNSVGKDVKQAGGAIGGSITDYLKTIEGSTDTYFAVYFDKASGQIKFLGDRLDVTGCEISDAVRKFANTNSLSLGVLDDAFDVLAGTGDSGRLASVAIQSMQQTLSDTVLTMSSDVSSSFKALKNAVRSGESFEAALDAFEAALKRSIPQVAAYAGREAEIIDEFSRAFKLLRGTASNADAYREAFEVIRKGLQTTTLTASDDVVEAFGKLSLAMANHRGIDEAARTAQAAIKNAVGDLSSETADAFSDLAKAAASGKIGPDDLRKFTAAFQKSTGDFVAIVNSATGETEFVGETAARVFSQASDNITNGIKNFLSKISEATYGTLSVFDAVAVLVDAALAAYENKQLREFATGSITSQLSPDTMMALGAAGVGDKEAVKLIGSEVYTGVSEALARSVAITGLSTAMGTLAGAIATALAPTGPIGWIAAGAAAVTGLGLSVAAEKTGYNTAENLHFNEYQKAARSGNYVDQDALRTRLSGTLNPLTGSVYSAEEIERMVAETNDVARRMYELNILGQLDRENIWETSKLSNVVSGAAGNNRAKQYKDIFGGTAEDTLRLASAMGVLDEMGVVSRTRSVSRGGRDTQVFKELAVTTEGAEEYLQQIRDLLGDQTLQLGATTGNYTYITDANGRNIAYNENNLTELGDLYDLLARQGVSTSDGTAAILETIRNSPDLYKNYIDTVGRGFAFSQTNQQRSLDVFNEVAGTGYTVADLNSIPGLAQQINQLTGDAFNSWYQKQNALASLSYANTSGDRFFEFGDAINQATSQVIAGTNLANVAGLSEMLAKFGFGITGGTQTLENGNAFDFSILTSDETALLENLQGIIIDTKAMAKRLGDEGLVLDNLTVSASDAEILASAGIMVYGQGDVAFAFNQSHLASRTGAERTTTDLTTTGTGESFSIAEISNAVKQSLGAGGITLGESSVTGAVDLTFDMDKIRKNMTSALFKMPSDIVSSLSPQMEAALATIGKVTEDGYLQITNKQILSGQKTITEVLNSTKGAYDKLSPEVQAALTNINDLVANSNADLEEHLGIAVGSAAERITTYADAITLISPIKREQLTQELIDMFNALGVTFTETANGFYMNIDATGEFYNSRMSLISIDTWERLDEDLRAHLSDLGVKAIQIGNQMCIDLSKVTEVGAQDIVAAFVDQPEEWAKLPDTVKEQLQQAGIITDENLLVIKKKIDTEVGEIANGWVLDWSELAPTVKKALDDSGINTSAGLAQICGIIDASEVPKEIEGTVVVPFEALPAEIKEALEQTGYNMEGKKVRLQTATEAAFGGMKTELASTISAFDDGANDIASAINAMTDSFLQMQMIQSQLKGGESIVGYTKNKDGTFTVQVKGNGFLGTGWNASHSTITTTNDNGTTRATRMNSNATGGIASGLTLTGELGRELAIFPDGSIKMLGEHGAELGDLPAGTRILNNEDTEEVLKYTGGLSKLDKYADGNTELIIPEEAPEVAGEPVAADMSRREAVELIAIAIHDASAILAESLGSALNLSSVISESAVGITSAIDGLELSSGTSSFASTLSSAAAPLYDYTSRTVDTAEKILDIVEAPVESGITDEQLETYKQQLAETKKLYALGVAVKDEFIKQQAHRQASEIRALLGYTTTEDGSLLKFLDPDIAEETKDEIVKLAGAIGDTTTEFVPLLNESLISTVVAGIENAKLAWKIAHDNDDRLGEERAHEAADYYRAMIGYTGGELPDSFRVLDENMSARDLESLKATAAHIGTLLTQWQEYEAIEETFGSGVTEALAAIGADVSSINEELISDVAAEIKAAKEDWANAMTDAERKAAHKRAEDARAQLGYSGGIDGSQVIFLDESTLTAGDKELITLQASLVEATNGNAEALNTLLTNLKTELSKQSSEESMAALKAIDNFQLELVRQSGQLMTADAAARASIEGAIYSGCNQVAAAVGAYVRYAENTMASQAREIEGLRSALNSLSSSSDSKATVGTHAAGGLVTGDTLARVGEFGKEEAIIPIEQPSVMAKIGHAIAGAAGFEGLSTVGTSGDSSGVISEIRASSELIAVAINEAMLVLGENMGTKYEDTVSRTAENNQTLVEAVVAAVTDGYSGLTEAINVVNTTTTGLGDTFGTSLDTFNTNLGSLIEGFQGAVQGQQDTLTSTVSLANEIIAQLLGTSTQQATEIASVDDALATVDSTLVNEVAAGILQAKADYQAAYEAGNAEAMAKAHEDAEAWREKLGYETDLAGQFISVLNAESLSTEEAVQTALVAGITETLAGNHVALDQVLNNLFNALGTKETELSTAMQALITTFKGEAQQKLNIMQTVGTVERSNIQSAIYSGCNQVAMAVGSYVRYAENTMASQAREISSLQSALSFARSAASKKGAAGGGVIEHDAFYRLGENNLSEAILPLRNKGIMSDVGETIASFMPESAGELRGALGIMNDVKPVTQHGPTTEDLVSQVAQHVLESVLPAMSGGMSGGEEKTPIYVGTLVADERGLKQLERKLYDIRKAEEVRRN